jgi:DNA polymerase III subunit epsilon
VLVCHNGAGQRNLRDCDNEAQTGSGGNNITGDYFVLLDVLATDNQEGDRRNLLMRFFFEHSPFDIKDRLRKRGYRRTDGSDGPPNSSWIDVTEEMLEDELKYLLA